MGKDLVAGRAQQFLDLIPHNGRMNVDAHRLTVGLLVNQLSTAYLVAKVRPVFEGKVSDEGGGHRRRRRRPEEGQLRLPQVARLLCVAPVHLVLPLLHPGFGEELRNSRGRILLSFLRADVCFKG